MSPVLAITAWRRMTLGVHLEDHGPEKGKASQAKTLQIFECVWYVLGVEPSITAWASKVSFGLLSELNIFKKLNSLIICIF